MVEVRDALVESSIASEPEREKEGESGFQKKAFISGLDTPSVKKESTDGVGK